MAALTEMEGLEEVPVERGRQMVTLSREFVTAAPGNPNGRLRLQRAT